MRGNSSKQRLVLCLLGAIPIIWVALLIAPALSDGLPGLFQKIGTVFDHPFSIHWGENSMKTVLALLGAYGLAVMVYLSSERNYRRGEEYGSAKWGSPEKLRKYAEREYNRNKILTLNISISLNGRKHRRNLNILIVGGSGAGKTRFYVKVNLMNANTSFVVLDPKL